MMSGKTIRTVGLFGQLVCLHMLAGCLAPGPLGPWNSTGALAPEPLVGRIEPVRVEGSMPPVAALPATPSNSIIPISTPTAPSEGNSDDAAPRTTAAVPDVNRIYGRTAQSDDRDRNPVIVIPGVLGSRLVDPNSGRVVWGEFGGQGINPNQPDGARLMALPMNPGQSLATLIDGVQPDGTLDALDVRILGIPFQIQAYRDLLEALGVGGYRDEHSKQPEIDYGHQSYSSFQFDYDWRRDNIENAQRLHRFILEKQAYVESERRKRYGEPLEPMKFDIVAHSMGGLVARYYLQYGDAEPPADGSAPELTWAGAARVQRLVMIATPNAGSLETVGNLVRGETLSRFLPKYPPALLGTMPALYQLLPRTRQNPVVVEGSRRAVDIMDPQTWKELRWGLLDPREHGVLAQLLPQVGSPDARLQIAYDHVAKCLQRARTFQAALDVPTVPPSGTTIHLIAGDAIPTVAQFRVNGRGELTVTAMQPGDGSVTRVSALMDERYSVNQKWTPRLVSPIKWTSVNFLASNHLGLTQSPEFADNILFLLLESQR